MNRGVASNETTRHTTGMGGAGQCDDFAARILSEHRAEHRARPGEDVPCQSSFATRPKLNGPRRIRL